MYSLRRAVEKIARSQSTAKHTVSFSHAHFTQPYYTKSHQFRKPATKTTTLKPEDWPKPSEIPFQVKVANSVNLIGHIDAPIQFQTSSDGKHWAGTVIVHHATSLSPPLWIPILFEGDLAHTAASHLKKDDHVHVAGQLTADPPVDGIESQANVQVMVHSLNFIVAAPETWKHFTPKEQQVATVDHPARISSTKKDGASAQSPWHDLLDKPEQWRDYRSDKLKGLNPKHPDFKRKDGILSLWLDRAPHWVLSDLKGVVFDDQIHKSNHGFDSPTYKPKNVIDDQTQQSNYVKKTKVDDMWKDLVENPDKWWDNRLDKKSEKSPDFKHKETGKPLWLAYSPAWVMSQLPPLRSKGNADSGKRETLLS